MKPSFKRLSLILLTVILLLCISGLTGCGKETAELVYELDEGGAGYLVDVDGTYIGEALEIPASHEGLPVIGIKDKAFKKCKALKSVAIALNEENDGFKIGSSAFSDCKALEKVEILTKGRLSIGGSAFSDCESLKAVDIPNSSEVYMGIYAFEYIGDITVSISNARLTIVDSAFFNNTASTLKLTSCTGSIKAVLTNAEYKDCSFDEIEGSAINLTLDNTKLPKEEMYLTAANAVFRGNVVYKNNYKTSLLFGKGNIIKNLTIESIGEESEFSQMTDGETYPLAERITVGSAVKYIPAGVFGNGSLAQLLDEDSKKLSITYLGASEAFYAIPYDTLYNGNLYTASYDLTSLDGTDAKLTFIDESGNTVASMDAPIGAPLEGPAIDLPNMTLVDGRIVNGYYLDSEHTSPWLIGSTVLNDTTIYLSFVDGAELKEAKLQSIRDAFKAEGERLFTIETGEGFPITLSYIKESFSASKFATVEYFGDEALTSAAPSIIDEMGNHKIYISVRSWDKSVQNVYVLSIDVKKSHSVVFYEPDGMVYKALSCIDGYEFPFPDAPKKLGHTFLGWSSDGTEAGIVNSEICKPSADCRFTAIYKKDKYTLTIKDTDLSYTVEWDQSIKLPLAAEISYYDFVGYQYEGERIDGYLDTDGYVISHYTFEKSIELSPVYEAKRYTLVLDGVTQYYTVEDGDITLPIKSRDWYSFAGWYTEEGGAGTKYEMIDTSSPANIILHSHLVPTVYTIRFMDGETVVYSQTFDFATRVTPPPVPERAGYTSSWESYELRPMDLDVQIARTPIDYTITYENTYGSYNSNAESYNIESNIILGGIEREHYTFEGWRDENGQPVTEIPAGTTGNLVLRAEWSVRKYAVYLYTDKTNYTVRQIEYNSSFNFDSVEIPTMTDKLFAGWYNQDFTEALTGSVTVGGDIYAYAKWDDSIAISSPEDFEKIRENPAGSFHLTADIDMRGNIVEPIPEFSGKLDGFGHKMYNFTLKINSSLGSFALFNINSGTIRSLTLDEVVCSVTTAPAAATDEDNIGVLVGVNNGTLSGCDVNIQSFTVTSQFSGSGNRYYLSIGGLVGRNNGSIYDCHTEVILTALFTPINNAGYYGTYFCEIYARMGGLVGLNNGKISASGSAFTANATGNAHGNDKGHARDNFHIGGLVGVNEASSSVERSFASSNITSAVNHIQRFAYGDSFIGGLIGTNNGTAKESYALGKIESYSVNTGYIGGFIGNVGATGSVTDCYTSANVSCTQASCVGGFVGHLSGSVQNCYSSGELNISGSVSNAAGFVGAIASGGIVNKSFTTSNVTTASGIGGFFCADNSSGTGIIQNSYYSSMATLSVNGEMHERAEEMGAKRDYLSNITSYEFLRNKMYFYGDFWSFTARLPILKWEIKTDGTSLANGTHFHCETCGNEFVLGTASGGESFYYDIPASCTTNGIRYFGCKSCGKSFEIITSPATGHSYENDAAGKDFCNTDVTVTYTCTAPSCGHSYTESFKATGHRHEHGDSCMNCGYVLIPSSCDKAGSLTFICDDCGETVVKKIDAAHLWEFASWASAPGCTEDGEGNYICTRCMENGITETTVMTVKNSKLGHYDTNGDSLCDREGCGKAIYDSSEAIEISTLEQLLAISRDAGNGSLSGTYILMADISLKGVAWEPIGTESAPFTGTLVGNGHKIGDVPLLSPNMLIGYCGLFGYNDGVITDLTVEYTHTSDFFEICKNRSITYGGIAAYNSGTINNCTVTGNVIMSFLTLAEVNSAGSSASAAQNVTLGLIVGENNGYIVGCEVKANYTLSFENYAYMGEEINDVDFGLLTSGNYKSMNVTAKQLIIAGALCGKNNMSISDSTVSGTGTVYNYLALSQFIDGKWGTLSATSSFTLGAIAGNQDLDGRGGNALTGTVSYSNGAGNHKPMAGNDPGNSYYSMTSSSSVAIFK